MYYRKALELQAFLDMAKDEGTGLSCPSCNNSIMIYTSIMVVSPYNQIPLFFTVRYHERL